MPIKVGINGFGRIGRNIMRTALDDKEIQFVAVNDVTDAKTLAHLLKYDSILGNLTHNVTHTDDTISVEGKSFKVFKTKDPGEIDWASISAPTEAQSISPGSLVLNTLKLLPSTEIVSSVCVTLCVKLPKIESYFSKWASVFASVTSFTATN